MSRVSTDPAVLAQLKSDLLDSGFVAVQAVVAPVAVTGVVVTVTYTTDDPAVTASNAQTIADGDAVSIAEQHETIEELRSQAAALVIDNAAVRTALASAISSGADAATAPAALTSSLITNAFTYTTDDPSITPNAAVTIADGDLYDAAEIHEAFVELVAEYNLVAADLGRAHDAVTKLINGGAVSAPVLGARTSTNGGVVITYTTDDPSITPNNAITIADGDLLTASNALESVEEFNELVDELGDDFAAIKVAYDLYLVAAGQATS